MLQTELKKKKCFLFVGVVFWRWGGDGYKWDGVRAGTSGMGWVQCCCCLPLKTAIQSNLHT